MTAHSPETSFPNLPRGNQRSDEWTVSRRSGDDGRAVSIVARQTILQLRVQCAIPTHFPITRMRTPGTVTFKELPMVRIFLNEGKAGRRFSGRRRGDLTMLNPPNADGKTLCGRGAGQNFFTVEMARHLSFHSFGSTVTSHSSVRRMPSSCGTRLCQPSLSRAFDTSASAREASTSTACRVKSGRFSLPAIL